MKKLFVILFFLSGCMTSPQKAFQLDSDTTFYSIQANEVKTVLMTKHFDAFPHIENQIPTSPEEAIVDWAKMHLKTSKMEKQKIWIIVHQAEMIQTDLPNESMFKFDEVNYTLNYQLEIQVRENDQVVKSIPVNGKGFVVLAKKSSLSQKEKSWAWLIQKMLVHLKEKVIENVSVS